MKEQYKQSALYIAYYSQRVRRNAMPSQIVLSTDGSHQ